MLAVPNANTVRVSRVAAARPALITTMLMLMLAAGAGAAQRVWGNVAAVAAFQRAADAYAFLHRQAERQLGLSHRAAGHPEAPIGRDELATAIRSAAPDRGGTLFTPAVVVEFRAQAARAVDGGCDAGELRSGVWELVHTAYSPAAGTAAVSECIARALPPLPPELEYRSAGTVLLVVDTHADLVVDVLPALLAGSELR